MASPAPDAAEARAAVDAPPSPSPSDDGGFASMLHTVQDIWREIPGLLSDRIELLTLELQRAGRALARLVMLVVVIAIVAVTAWLLVWGLIVAVLVQAGLALPWVLLGAVALHLLVAWVAVARVHGLLSQLTLPATRRHLTLRPSIPPAADRASAASP